MAQPAPEYEMAIIMPDWSLLSKDLLDTISKYLDNCFDVIHARSVCHHWRSTISFPDRLLLSTYSISPLPSIFGPYSTNKPPYFVEKIPFFLLRNHKTPLCDDSDFPCEYFMGWIKRDESAGQISSSPLQCSVNVKIPGSDIKLMNVLDCQGEMVSLGHQYRIMGEKHNDRIHMAVLPLNKEGGGEFVVLYNDDYNGFVSVLQNSEMSWTELSEISDANCLNVIAFRGKFYASCENGVIFVIDLYSLQVTPLPSTKPQHLKGVVNYLVPSSNDELFLVETFLTRTDSVEFRVCRLDEEVGKWDEVIDYSGDRILFIGALGNFTCLAKDLRDDCEKNKHSLLTTSGPDGSHLDWCCLCLTPIMTLLLY